MLLIANSQNILATYLSGAQVSTITPTSTRQTTAMDFSYANETVCWVHVGDSAAQTQLKCARMPGLKGFVDEYTINISLSLHRESPAPAHGAGEGGGDGRGKACLGQAGSGEWMDGMTPDWSRSLDKSPQLRPRQRVECGNVCLDLGQSYVHASSPLSELSL